MLHRQIEDNEIVERYVRDRLRPEEREAFEEHYFACDECFGKVQAMEGFVAGIHDAARRGDLSDTPGETVRHTSFDWAVWAFAGTSFAAIVLAIVTGWAYLHRIPKLQQELNAATAAAKAQPTTVAQLRSEEPLSLSPEANVPVVVLQSSRGEGSNYAVLAPGARQLILWAEIGPSRYTTYSMEIDSSSGNPVTRVDGLTRGPYGALAASVPAEALRPGTLRIKLIGRTPQPPSLVSEYRLQIRAP
jgi:hypothetical protein